MIVMKFGGSSLATSDALTRVAGLIAARVRRVPVVVVSAMGRTTDRLVDAVDLAARGEPAAARRRVAALRDDLLATAAPVLADVAGSSRVCLTRTATSSIGRWPNWPRGTSGPARG